MILGQLSLALAALIAGQSNGAAPSEAKPSQGEISKAQASTLLSTCGARKFETTADVPTNGKVRRTKITLCAADSDTNADWVSKLEKAIAQIEAHPTFPAETKAKLLGDLRSEIARVKSAQSPFDLGKPVKSANVSSAPAVSAPAAPIATAPRLPEKSPLAEFSALPPLPRAPALAAASTKAAAPVRRGPQLSVQCVMVGFSKPQRCGVIESDERLVVSAKEPFKGPVSLRFSRPDSDVSAEIPFASESVSAGQMARFSVPKAICARRIFAEFELEAVSPVINGGRSGERLGTFKARCGV